MAILLEENVRISVTVGDEQVVFIFPPYDGMRMEIKELATSRIRGRGLKQRMDIHGARERFVDKTLLDIENVNYRDEKGEAKPLNNKVKDWKTKIPFNWKSSAASFFEESEVLSEEEVGE